MYSNKAKRMVAGQIINMLENNILNDNGGEGFIGWLEDGDVFYNAECYTDEEINEAMELAKEIAPALDEISWKLDTIWNI